MGLYTPISVLDTGTSFAKQQNDRNDVKAPGCSLSHISYHFTARSRTLKRNMVSSFLLTPRTTVSHFSLQCAESIPPEIWAYILAFLAVYECFPVALTCKLFRELLTHQRRVRGEDRWRSWLNAGSASESMLRWTKDLGRPLMRAREFINMPNSFSMEHQHIALHEGNVFVANPPTGCIRVFWRDGELVRRFFRLGDTGKELSQPSGIAIAPETNEESASSLSVHFTSHQPCAYSSCLWP